MIGIRSGRHNPGNERLFNYEGNPTLAIHRRSFCAGNRARRQRVRRAFCAAYASFAVAPGIAREVSFAEHPRFAANRALLPGGEFQLGFFEIEVDEKKEEDEEE
jgi:hypothetical protein